MNLKTEVGKEKKEAFTLVEERMLGSIRANDEEKLLEARAIKAEKEKKSFMSQAGTLLCQRY